MFQKVTQPELGDMGRRPAAGKPVKPKGLNFASTLVLMLNQWQDSCGTEKGNEEMVSKVEPGVFLITLLSCSSNFLMVSKQFSLTLIFKNKLCLKWTLWGSCYRFSFN